MKIFGWKNIPKSFVLTPACSLLLLLPMLPPLVVLHSGFDAGVASVAAASVASALATAVASAAVGATVTAPC